MKAQLNVDVLIVGAGLSGICAAYHLQRGNPNKTFAIVEARDAIGGTWDLFRYPGIRSDSDMYTLGYSFRPWTAPNSITGGESILKYIRDTAAMYDIERHIHYGQRVERARWSTGDARWTVDARNAVGDLTRVSCKFLFLCSGYYDYAGGYTPDFAGTERFRGRIVHPQNWTSDVDHAGKRVVVIGSGATAVTLVPELAKQAAHVTMLQRSPTYIVSVPSKDPVANWLREKLPNPAAHATTRWKNVLLGIGFFQFSRRYPERANKLMVKWAANQLQGSADIATHFTPSYNVWDQRLCLVPDADLFAAIRERRASVVTDHIETFTERGIALRSGEQLEADLIVTATGLKLRVFGGIALELDGARVDPASLMVYRGVMCSDLPNFAFATGYTNASWTLKAELTCRYVSRLLAHMDRHGYASAMPRRDPAIHEVPLLDFASGYVQRSIAEFPRQGHVTPWRVHQNYVRDMRMLRYSRLDDGVLAFSDASGAARPARESAVARYR